MVFFSPLVPRRACDYELTFATEHYNVDLALLLRSRHGWDGQGPIRVRVNIPSTGRVKSNKHDKPAFSTGNLPAGSGVVLQQDGLILGAGGPGCDCGWWNQPRPGFDGGTALRVTVETLMTGGGSLFAGGGGGANGGHNNGYRFDGAGGGGAGSDPGTGGAGRPFRWGNGWGGGHPGQNGTSTTGGAGGGAANDAGRCDTIPGGRGGDLGRPGESARGAPGGKAGHAILGLANLVRRDKNTIRGLVA